MASLDGVYTTLKRARKDLAKLKGDIESLRTKGERDVTILERHPRNRRWARYKISTPLNDISADIGVITGTFRAALDQLVCALYERRNNRSPPRPPKRRMQFSICKAPKDFKSRIRPDLEGLHVDDIAFIEKLQPYNGSDY